MKSSMLFVTVLLLPLIGTSFSHGDWSYDYYDDLSTNKAVSDSYLHSPFWEPGHFYLYGCLLYTASGGNPLPALAFCTGFEVDSEAYLAYRFPLSGTSPPRDICGTLEIDVTIFSQGHLSYMVSRWGQEWSPPRPLNGGHQKIVLRSHYDYAACYVALRGFGVAIDNLSVAITDRCVPGDANADGTVDEDDAAVLAACWGQSGYLLDGDFNYDGVVNAADASIMAANWGYGIPEPSTLVLVGLGVAGLLARWRCRR